MPPVALSAARDAKKTSSLETEVPTADLQALTMEKSSNEGVNLQQSPHKRSAHVRLALCAETVFGETLYLHVEDGTPPRPLACAREGLWLIDFSLPEIQCGTFRYRYARSGAYPEDHWRNTIVAAGSAVLIRDSLPDADSTETPAHTQPQPQFASAAFRDVLFPKPPVAELPNFDQEGLCLRLSVCTPRIVAGDTVFAVGAVGALRGDGVRMSHVGDGVWKASVYVKGERLLQGLGYRYVIKDVKGTVKAKEMRGRVASLEPEEMTWIDSEMCEGRSCAVDIGKDDVFDYGKPWKGSGIAIPVFSIRTRNSCGVGEFNDLHKIVDLCVATRHQLLQLLPVNDTTSHMNWRDSYPYSAVSSFALHPQYVNLASLGHMPADMEKEYNQKREELNALPEIDYERVMETKMSFLKRMYALHKENFLKSREFTDWFATNQSWLVPYALFRFFMEVNGTAKFDNWGKRASLTPAEMEAFAAPDTFHFDYLGLVYYTQFHLHKQLSVASQYAAEHQVIFKGDLPIGVNRYCTDTWVAPHLFRLHMQAGAPPDYFCDHGQNWFFPTYDWDAMKAEGYSWWRDRLQHMANYFHAYRIDHILGFFRIWEIPTGFKTGMSGRYRPVIPITRYELEARGLWDIDRYTMPYVHDGLLRRGLGDELAERVKVRFFESAYGERLQFKKEFDTEEKCELGLKVNDQAPEWLRAESERVKKCLFALMNNVCLLKDETDPNAFHPRFLIDRTSSFQELPSDEWRRALHDLYTDYFYHRQEDIWRRSAMEKLPMMKNASEMLVCGEDLGFMPKCVPSVMRETSILSLYIQRMPEGDIDFGMPEEYDYECVASTSSHDVSTLRGWWKEMAEGKRRRYWKYVLKRPEASSPPTECSPEIVQEIVEDHLKCPAMWTILPIQDVLGMSAALRRPNAEEEQINDPSNGMHYWRFRLHVNIEDILADKIFVAKVAALNKVHGRGDAY